MPDFCSAKHVLVPFELSAGVYRGLERLRFIKNPDCGACIPLRMNLPR